MGIALDCRLVLELLFRDWNECNSIALPITWTTLGGSHYQYEFQESSDSLSSLDFLIAEGRVGEMPHEA